MEATAGGLVSIPCILLITLLWQPPEPGMIPAALRVVKSLVDSKCLPHMKVLPHLEKVRQQFQFLN